MHLSDCIFLNIENDPSASQEVAGVYLRRNLWKSESILNFIGRMGVRNSSVTKKTGTVESRSPHSLSLSLSLSFISFIRENINKMHYYAS